jgi:hypothetical protein
MDFDRNRKILASIKQQVTIGRITDIYLSIFSQIPPIYFFPFGVQPLLHPDRVLLFYLDCNG